MCKELEEALEIANVMNEELRVRSGVRMKEIELDKESVKYNHELNLRQLALDEKNIDNYAMNIEQKTVNEHKYKIFACFVIVIVILILSLFVYIGRFNEIKDIVLLIVTAIISSVGGYGMGKKSNS